MSIIYIPASVAESNLSFTDITTANVSTSQHGLCPKITNTANFLKGDGTWTAVNTITPYSNIASLANTISSASDIAVDGILKFSVPETAKYMLFGVAYERANGGGSYVSFNAVLKSGSSTYASATHRAYNNVYFIIGDMYFSCMAFAVCDLTAGDYVHLGAGVSGGTSNRYIFGDSSGGTYINSTVLFALKVG